MSDNDVRWLVVRAPQRVAESYAYGFTKIVDVNPGEGYGPVVTMIVLGRPGADEADSLARQQSARFASGLHWSKLATNWAEAFAFSRELATQEG